VNCGSTVALHCFPQIIQYEVTVVRRHAQLDAFKTYERKALAYHSDLNSLDYCFPSENNVVFTKKVFGRRGQNLVGVPAAVHTRSIDMLTVFRWARIRSLTALLLLPFALFLVDCTGPSPPYAYTSSQMAVDIPKQLAANSATGGLTIALVDDQRVVWVQSFGYADVASHTLATPDTVYRIASNSKTFTAAMILQLYEQGKLSLDDPLTKYIPNFSIKQPLGFPAGGPVTIRSMLTHHNGITGEIFNWAVTSAPDPNFNSELVTYLQGEYLQYPPDYFYAYSNTAVSLLGPVIEAASGQSLQAYSDSLFHTLGMDNTSMSIDSPNVSDLATGYTAGQALPTRYYINVGGSGAIVSNILDMAKYIKMINADGMGERGQVLKPGTVDMMLTAQNGGMPLDFDARMGFLWDLNDADLSYAGNLCSKEGQVSGFHSWVEILRDYKLGVVVLANDEGVSVSDIAKQTLKLALQEKAGLAPPPAYVPPYSPPVTWDQARLDALQGIYMINSGPPPPLTVTSVPGGLTVNLNGAINNVVPKADGWFSAPGSQTAEFEFNQVAGKNVIVAHTGGQNLLLASYFSPLTPPAISAAWTARAGTYQATNWTAWSAVMPAPPMTLAIQNGLLIFGGTFVLTPVSDTLAYVAGFGNNGGASLQVLSPGPNEQIQMLGVKYKKQ
jgi:CubicO group peptidase (beta-lactamase class C family)